MRLSDIGGKINEAAEDTFVSALKGLKSWQVVIMNNYYRGKYSDYSGRYFYVLATSPEEASQVVLDNADAILKDLLAMKAHNGRSILPRSSAVRITADRIGKIEDGTVAGRMSTTSFKKMYSPQGPMMVKLSNGAIADVQGQEQGVAEADYSPMTKDSMKADKIKSLKNLIAIAKEQGRGLRVQELELELKKLQSVTEDASTLNVGDPVIITGNVEFNGATGEVDSFGRNNAFVVVNLYNHGKHSFHSSDVSYNDYADSDEEEARMYDAGEFREGYLDNPGQEDSPVAQAIIRRIMLQRTDLLAKYGPEKVGSAVDEVADFVGDVDEIGSSDVSGWIRHVEQMLGNMGESQFESEGAPKSALGKALWRDLSKFKKASPAQQQRNKERWAQRQAEKNKEVDEGVATSLPMSDAVKLLRQYGADNFKTTTNELHFYKDGRPFSVDLIMNPDTTRSVTLSSLNSATRGLKGQDVAEGAKVDRMVKHIAKSERGAGKSAEEAENIAWATANKRGYLDNKNKKAK